MAWISVVLTWLWRWLCLILGRAEIGEWCMDIKRSTTFPGVIGWFAKTLCSSLHPYYSYFTNLTWNRMNICVSVLRDHSWYELGNHIGCWRSSPGWPLARQAHYSLCYYSSPGIIISSLHDTFYICLALGPNTDDTIMIFDWSLPLNHSITFGK